MHCGIRTVLSRRRSGDLMLGRLLRRALAGLGATLLAVPAWAQDPTIDRGDTAWMMTSVALVLLMTLPGLALFYGGMVRKMNVLAIIMQSFATCCIVSILWMLVGYSLAFSGDGMFVGDLGKALLRTVGVG